MAKSNLTQPLVKRIKQVRLMMKSYLHACPLLFIVSLLISFPVKLIGQDELRKELDHMFAKVKPQMVPTGCLIDYATELESLDKFNGVISASSKTCDVITYSHVLQTLFSSALDNTMFQEFKSNLYAAEKNNVESKTCRLSVVFNDYAQLTAECLKSGAITFNDGQVEIKKADAFQIKKLCASCIIDNIKHINSIEFSAPKNLISADTPISDIQIDWGKGLHSLFSHPVSATLDEGHHTIDVVITDSSGEKYHTSTCIDITSKGNTDLTRSWDFFTGIETDSITGTSYNGIITKADMFIKYASSNPSHKIRKPLIFVEGFDLRDFNPRGYGSMYHSKIYKQWEDFIESNGFDFIYVDWREAGAYIQANAYTLIEVIKYINSKRDSHSSPGIIIGHSMGGLVARYALKTMENRGQLHDIGTYVSYDSPHMGANVPMGLLYGFNGILKFLKEKNIIDSLLKKYTEVESLIQTGMMYAYSPAAQQMLMNYVDPMGNVNNYAHTQWQSELNELGFPNGDIGKEFKKLAIANSDYTPMELTGSLIHCDFSAGVNTLPVLSPLMSMAVGILFQDVIAGLLTVLPGRDEITGGVDCRVALRNGMKITDINIGYKKDFLWVIPISKNVFSYSKNYYGNCLYDTYSGSLQYYDGTANTDEGGIPIIYNWSYDVQATPTFSFIPTSSALAVASGLNNTPTLFSSRPNISDLVFDAVRMENNPEYQIHTEISQESKDWLSQQLQTVIVGPKYGKNGSKYYISGQEGPVVWTISDTSIATISEEGVLTVAANGTVKLTATVNGNSYSKNIIVGVPKFILRSSHVLGGYRIDADIISSEFKNYSSSINKDINFRWGVKYAGKNIRWTQTHSPSILIPLEDGSKEVTVFLAIVDSNGYIRSMQSVNAHSSDLFSVSNNILSIDSNGNIYKEDGSLYSYKNGKIYLTRDTSLPADYQRAIWTSTKGTVLSPFASTYGFTVTNGEIPIKQVLPQDEVNFILQNGEAGQAFIYTLALLNPEDKIVQFIPVTIKRK